MAQLKFRWYQCENTMLFPHNSRPQSHPRPRNIRHQAVMSIQQMLFHLYIRKSKNEIEPCY